MQYKVTKKCAGFRNQLWEKDTIVDDVGPNERVPTQFVLLEEVKEPEKAPIDPRAPVEVEPGKTLKLRGGFGREVEQEKIGRIMTIDKVPNDGKPPRKLRKKKDAGSVKK